MAKAYSFLVYATSPICTGDSLEPHKILRNVDIPLLFKRTVKKYTDVISFICKNLIHTQNSLQVEDLSQMLNREIGPRAAVQT